MLDTEGQTKGDYSNFGGNLIVLEAGAPVINVTPFILSPF